MHERLEKYYDGRTCNDDPLRSSALAALWALCEGRTHDGDLFRMHSDEFINAYLFPEDYEYWIAEKRKALGQIQDE